jgi:hypothetical protein
MQVLQRIAGLQAAASSIESEGSSTEPEVSPSPHQSATSSSTEPETSAAPALI